MPEGVTVFPNARFREGLWLNGLGVSWDIAAEPPEAAAADFGWRFAIARIDQDVPFSTYTSIDRIFTLLSGDGLTLDVAGLGRLAVDAAFVPWRFPGDVATSCELKGSPCRALNLFLRRGMWRADVQIVGDAAQFPVANCDAALLFALKGEAVCDGQRLREGDAAIAPPGTLASSPGGLLYLARLRRGG